MVDRLFQIVHILMKQESITSAELAERFECSTRTIMRDIDKLSMAGIPVYTNKGRNGGISLLPNYILDRTVLTDEEQMQVLSSLQAIKETSFGNEKEALSKLSSFFGADNQDWIEIEFSKWGEPGKVENYFKTIKKSILTHHIIKIDYSSNNRSNTTRKVKPLKLCFKGYAWYLYGFCMLRKDYRFFKLSRIMELADTSEIFTPVMVGRVLEDIYEYNTQSVHVKMKVQPDLFYRVLEELPQGEIDDDGSMIIEFDTNDSEETVNYILSLGPNAKVLEPAWYQQKVVAQIEKIRTTYL